MGILTQAKVYLLAASNQPKDGSIDIPLGYNTHLTIYGVDSGSNANLGAALQTTVPLQGVDLQASLGTNYSQKMGVDTSATLRLKVPLDKKVTLYGEAGMNYSSLFGPTRHVGGGLLLSPCRDFDIAVGGRRDFTPGYAPQNSFNAGARWHF